MTALVLRELRLATAGGAAALPLIFFLLVATLFPFAVGPDGPLLARWQYGLGKAVVFTSDVKNRWASKWMEWTFNFIMKKFKLHKTLTGCSLNHRQSV